MAISKTIATNASAIGKIKIPNDETQYRLKADTVDNFHVADSDFPYQGETTFSWNMADLACYGPPDYSATINYYTDNYVCYNGGVYKSLSGSNKGNTPSSSPTKWEDVTNSHNFKVVAYDSTKTYSINDRVRVGTTFYVSLVNDNTNHAPASSATYWRKVSFDIYILIDTGQSYYSNYVKFQVQGAYDNVSGTTQLKQYCRNQNYWNIDTVGYNGQKQTGVYQVTANTNHFWFRFSAPTATYPYSQFNGSATIYCNIPITAVRLVDYDNDNADFATVANYNYVIIANDFRYTNLKPYFVSGMQTAGAVTLGGDVLSNNSLKLTGKLFDKNSSAGASGQILSSTGSQVQWIDAPSFIDTNTWRPIKVDGVEKFSSSISSGAVDFVSGTNISLGCSGGKITINNTYTHPTYDAVNAGLYKIGRDATGHVVIGDSFTIPTKNSWNYDDRYKVLQSPITNPTASGTTTSFIDSITQNNQGVVTVTKKTIDFSGYATTTQLENYVTTTTNQTINGVKTFTSRPFYTEAGGTDEFLIRSDLNEIAFSGSYNDLSNKPNISNATITIKQPGTSDQTLTLNGSAKTINLVDTNTTYAFATGETNGTFKITPSGGSAQSVLIKGLQDPAFSSFTTSITSSSTNTQVPTAKAVWDLVDGLPEAMVFKGTLGTGGTITSLPTADATNEGFVYKVITAGTYASKTAKVGDTFVCAKTGTSTYEWILIPSGDDVEDTWRAIKVNDTELLGNGISTGAVNFKNGNNITFTGSGNNITVGVASGYSIPLTSKQNDWDAKQPAGNYVTTDTVQTITANKTFGDSSTAVEAKIRNGAFVLGGVEESVSNTTSKISFQNNSGIEYHYIKANATGVIFSAVNNDYGFYSYGFTPIASNELDLGRSNTSNGRWRNVHMCGSLMKYNGDTAYTLTLQNKTGTIALLSDIPSYTDTNYYHTPLFNSGLNIGTGVPNKLDGLFVPDASTTQKGVLKIGTTASDAAAGNHTHDYSSVYAAINHNHDGIYSPIGHTHPLSIAADTGTSEITLAHDGKYKITAGGSTFIFTMPSGTTTDHNQTVKGDGVTFGVDDVIDIVDGTGINVVGNATAKTITINHSNSITAGTASEGGESRTLAFGGTFNVPSVTYDAQGHITSTGSAALTLPAAPSNDTWRAIYVNGVQKLDTSPGGAIVYLNFADSTYADIGYTTGSGSTPAKLVVNVDTDQLVTDLSGTYIVPITVSNKKKFSVDASTAGNAVASKIVARSAAGTIQTEKLAVSSGTTTKATMQYNTTDECVEFIFA